MQLTSTETFSVSFPSEYGYIQVAWESIRAEHRKDGDYLSFITVGLQELSFYDKYKGEDLLSRFRESCLEQRGHVEVVADRELQVAGITSWIRTAKAEDGYTYYFGLLPINSTFGYMIIGDCDTVSKDIYEPLFDDVWQSLQYFGDPVSAMKKQQDGVNAILNKYTTPEPASTPEAEKIFEPFVVPDAEAFTIGGHQFTLTGESECSISDGDGALYVKIQAQAPANTPADIINDYEDGKVYLQFYFKGIYNAGIPTGKFRFEEEKDTSWMTYVWKGGFHYMQSLTAEVTLQDGWLGINGYFNEYPVQIAVKIPQQQDWHSYRFLTVEEIETAPAAIVRHVWLKDPYAGTLQEVLYPLTNLHTLTIQYADALLAADFKAVPKAIRRMKELKQLQLMGVAALDWLPEWLGDVKSLEQLRVSESKIEGIHPYIFQLPELKKLYLSDNQLASIHPGLPEKLDTLTVNRNRLKTVPKSVTKLDSLSIEDNPLESLPDGLENIPHLYLELEKKMTLMDYTYQGAGPYDDSVFFAKHDPILLETLEQAISTAGLDAYKEGLVARTRKAVALATTEADTYTETGNHRFGGLPDLPKGEAYPTFTDWEEQTRGLQFIAQINCAAIAHLQDYLPRTGILYFFIVDQEEMGPKVIYYDGDMSALISAKELDIDPDFIYEQNGIFPPFRAEAGVYPSTPVMYNAHHLYPELSEMEELYDETEALETALKGGAVTPVHSMNSYVFKQHDTPEMEAVNEKKGKPDEWMVLLRVSSDRNPGFCFFDAGEIYFVIHKSDLARKDFSNVFCGLESS